MVNINVLIIKYLFVDLNLIFLVLFFFNIVGFLNIYVTYNFYIVLTQ